MNDKCEKLSDSRRSSAAFYGKREGTVTVDGCARIIPVDQVKTTIFSAI